MEVLAGQSIAWIPSGPAAASSDNGVFGKMAKLASASQHVKLTFRFPASTAGTFGVPARFSPEREGFGAVPLTARSASVESSSEVRESVISPEETSLVGVPGFRVKSCRIW